SQATATGRRIRPPLGGGTNVPGPCGGREARRSGAQGIGVETSGRKGRARQDRGGRPPQPSPICDGDPNGRSRAAEQELRIGDCPVSKRRQTLPQRRGADGAEVGTRGARRGEVESRGRSE